MCEYCEGKVDFRKNLMGEIYIDGDNNLTDDLELEDVKINYYPMCGRKLEDWLCEIVDKDCGEDHNLGFTKGMFYEYKWN